MGVLLNGDRIKVRNVVRTRVLRWGDVTDVCVEKLLGRLTFVLKSGESMSTELASNGPYILVYLTRRQLCRLLTRLRERLAAAA